MSTAVASCGLTNTRDIQADLAEAEEIASLACDPCLLEEAVRHEFIPLAGWPVVS
jgi:hypothetical protein